MWDYRDEWMSMCANLICPRYTLYWFLLSGVAIFLSEQWTTICWTSDIARFTGCSAGSSRFRKLGESGRGRRRMQKLQLGGKGDTDLSLFNVNLCGRKQSGAGGMCGWKAAAFVRIHKRRSKRYLHKEVIRFIIDHTCPKPWLWKK